MNIVSEGIDVSDNQAPPGVDWSGVGWGYGKALEGTTLLDIAF